MERIERSGQRPLVRTQYGMPREDGFHVTRHTFAGVVPATGETTTQLAAWLGHNDPAFTLRTYVHFMPKSGRRALAALGSWMATAGVPAPREAPDDADSPQHTG
ncbi:hypothetical protein ACLGI4_20970 [Streptomyces sp. HMX112]|uniref:hypothetical protein n=1 Tax=Streptomyces sp. HMX112 TaxID=3390850 RepID=UPI003A80DCDA